MSDCKWCKKELKKTAKKFCNSTCANKFRWSDPEYKTKTSNSMRRYYKEHPSCRNGENNSFYGKHHSKDTLIKIGEKSKKIGWWAKYNKENPKPGILNGMFGKHQSQQAKEKTRIGNLNRYDKGYKQKINFKDTYPEKVYESFLKFSGFKEFIDYFKQKNIANITITDFYFPQTKTCIFIDGDYWHCNPDKYSADYFHKQCHKKAEQIWKKDENNSNLLKSNGYNVIRIWESDIKREKLYA